MDRASRERLSSAASAVPAHAAARRAPSCPVLTGGRALTWTGGSPALFSVFFFFSLSLLAFALVFVPFDNDEHCCAETALAFGSLGIVNPPGGEQRWALLSSGFFPPSVPRRPCSSLELAGHFGA
ncbi:hypothetical protein NL676_017928 [Syzygium grande]|nr:hypothetical protein NL676_017928 [Syzygium grande]